MKVCRRWRYLILGSAIYLNLRLVCSPGTPVAEMLAHSPSFPLIIFHDDNDRDLTPEAEGRIMFALENRDRVQRIYLMVSLPSLRKVIMAIGGQFPLLEFLHIIAPFGHNAHVVLPATFRAPRLNYLVLKHFTSPIGPPLLTTSVSLVKLSLQWIRPSKNLYPDHLFQVLSLLPQLQDVEISFSSPIPKREIERHTSRMPNITHTTLPNLRTFLFDGVSAYLEALLSHTNAPLLELLSLSFSNQLSFSVPHLSQFVAATENPRLSSLRFFFYHKAVAAFMPLFKTALYIGVRCGHLDWQVSSMAQIFNVLCPLFSTVADLTLDYRSHTLSSEWHNQADRTQWRKLLRPFRNVETLRVHDGLVGEISRCLALDGEPASEVLPELKTLVCPMGSRDDRTFATFVHDREVAGLPINLIEQAFPAGQVDYTFETPAGKEYIN